MDMNWKLILHLILVLIGIGFFLYSYIKEKKIYQLLFVVWIPTTLLAYISTNKIFLTILGIVELIFFVLVVYFLFRSPDRKKGGSQNVPEQPDSYGKEETEVPEQESAEAAADEVFVAAETTGDTENE